MSMLTRLFFIVIGIAGNVHAQTFVSHPACQILPKGYVVQTVHCTDNRQNCGNPTPIPYGKPDKAFITINKGTLVTIKNSTAGGSDESRCMLENDVYPLIKWNGAEYVAFDLGNGQEVRTDLGKTWHIKVTNQ